jgi:hypothetical protein
MKLEYMLLPYWLEPQFTSYHLFLLLGLQHKMTGDHGFFFISLGVVYKAIFTRMTKHLTSMRMNKISKIWMKSKLFIQMYAVHPRMSNTKVIKRFHPLKREEAITIYSLTKLSLGISQIFPMMLLGV